MNFQDLIAKMRQLDETPVEPMDGAGAGDECMAPPSVPGEGEFLTTECGDEMMPHEPPKQSDSVTMNVSMNGSGAGGIRDLMAILKNIEDAGHAGHADHDDVLVGMETDETFENEPNTQTSDVAAVTPTGDDLASKGGEAIKVNGGGNPMREGLLAHLANLYQEVKSR